MLVRPATASEAVFRACPLKLPVRCHEGRTLFSVHVAVRGRFLLVCLLAVVWRALSLRGRACCRIFFGLNSLHHFRPPYSASGVRVWCCRRCVKCCTIKHVHHAYRMWKRRYAERSLALERRGRSSWLQSCNRQMCLAGSEFAPVVWPQAAFRSHRARFCCLLPV